MLCLPVASSFLFGRRRSIFVMPMAFALAGCTSAPELVRYTLPPPIYAQTPAVTAPVVMVPEVQLPSYAQDQGIATQSGASTIKIDANHRWTGYPSEMLTGALIQRLRQQGVNAWSTMSASRLQGDYRAMVSFDSFLRSAQGAALLTGSVDLIRDKQQVRSIRFDIDVPAAGYAYDAYAQAAALGVGRLAALIRDALDDMPAKNVGAGIEESQ
ncbi:MAG: membrane integrity-associated transporter subunit PqiC [Congregibacter sp.]